MKKLLSLVLLFLLLVSCSDSSTNRIAKMNAEELAYHFPTLFDSPPPQEFIIDTEKDTVIFGKSGTLLAIEAGTFTDKDGNSLKGKLTLQLKEALSLSEMLENKLTTQTVEGQVLQSGGMFDLRAKSDKKEEITISKPIHAEIPTQKKIGNMSVYEGIQVNENAPVQWKKEKELENWLTEIPLEQLNFFPKRGNSIAKNHKKENNFSENIFRFVQDTTNSWQSEEARICGISKYILEGLSDKKFQGTFISTYEFEKRLKAMNECCGNDLIAIYLKNLDKNLWEADQLAAEYLTKNKKCRAYIFEEFAQEKSTRVKPKEKINRALQKHIEKLFKNKEKAWTKFKKDFEKWDKKREELQTEVVQKLENERQFAQRLNYSFDLNRLGWTNIDRLMKYENQIAVTFDVKVKDLELKEAGRVFLIFPNEKIIIDLSRNEEGNFYAKQGNEDVIYLPKGIDIILKAVTEKNKQLYTGELDLVVKSKIKETIKVAQTTDKKIADRIKQFEQEIVVATLPTNFVASNSPTNSPTSFTRNPIITRKDFSAKKFEQALENHYKSKPVLDDYAECCYEMDLVKGKQIFENECKQCHAIHKKLVGPALRDSEARWGSHTATINFIKYPQKVIDSGDPYGQKLFNEYQQYMPNYTHLSNEDVSSVLEYIKKESKEYSYSDFRKK